MRGWFLQLCVLFSCLICLKVQSQENPKIGLVLSGGGAKGIAHIGVLKSMEEAGVVPDYIVGTSMGAIVGALYSLGYSADEIEAKILAIDWDLILTNQVPLNSIAFEEKEYYNRYMIEFPFSEGKVKLPNGLIESQSLTEILQYHLWPSLKYDHFDEFPIPFRCIGTDLQTGEAIVFDSGSLYKAVRSSMAMPGVFTAVDLDSTYAVDGGLVENFPVNRVLEMGADYVIGVNVSSTTLSGQESFETIGEIAMSVAMIGSNKRSASEIDSCDIYIEPEVGVFSAGNFTKAESILEAGTRAGRLHKSEFEHLASLLNKSEPPPSPEVKPLTLSSVRFDDSELFSEKLLQSKLDLSLPDNVNRDELTNSARQIFGINGFHKVEYKLNPENKDELLIDLQEKTPGRLFASLHIDNIFATGLLLNLTYRDLLGKDSRSIFILDISKNPKFRFDYYKYIGQRKRLALNFRYDFLNLESPIYEKGDLKDVSKSQTHRLRLGFLSTQSLKQSFTFHGFYNHESGRDQFQRIVPEEIDKLKLSNAGVEFGYFRNTLDNRNFPTKGVELNSLLRAIGWSKYELVAQSGVDSVGLSVGSDFLIPIEVYQDVLDALTPDLYFELIAQIRKYFPVNGSMSLVGDFGFGLTLGELDSEQFKNEFSISGSRRLNPSDFRAYGYNYDELSAPNLAVASASIQQIIFRNLFLRGGASLIGTYNYINFKNVSEEFSFDDFKEENLTLGYGLEASYRSRLGPISAGISKNTDDGHLRYFFSFGYSFNYSDP